MLERSSMLFLGLAVLEKGEGRSGVIGTAALAGCERPTAQRDLKAYRRLGHFYVCNPTLL
jgi:hypothetical protein